MKVLKSSRYVCFYVETDSDQYPFFRRSGGGSWENLMGESWESCDSSDGALEEAYQRFLRDEGVSTSE